MNVPEVNYPISELMDKEELKRDFHSFYIPIERKSKHLYDWFDKINKKLAKSRLG